MMAVFHLAASSGSWLCSCCLTVTLSRLTGTLEHLYFSYCDKSKCLLYKNVTQKPEKHIFKDISFTNGKCIVFAVSKFLVSVYSYDKFSLKKANNYVVNYPSGI